MGIKRQITHLLSRWYSSMQKNPENTYEAASFLDVVSSNKNVINKMLC